MISIVHLRQRLFKNESLLWKGVDNGSNILKTYRVFSDGHPIQMPRSRKTAIPEWAIEATITNRFYPDTAPAAREIFNNIIV
jgi:hypothetical protein